MHVVFLSPEVWPYARVGGLAEVSHDLPRALGARGHTVSVISPRIRLTPELEEGLERTDIALEVPVSWQTHRAEVYLHHSIQPGVTLYLIRQDHLFDREGLYGNAYGFYEDNAERFIFFSRACLELAQALGRPVDLVHANDWTTGMVPVYLKTLYKQTEHLAGAGSLMAVHNLANQGSFWHYDMPLTGLGWELFTPECIEFYGKINFLKAGLVFADLISTVSPTYAQEILTPEMGHGLDRVISERKECLTAVINGVDYHVWDPAGDGHLAASYDKDHLDNKRLCRQDLRQAFTLPPDSPRPLVAVIGRLEERKGLDLILEGMEAMFQLGLDVVVMGYGGDHYHQALLALAERNPDRLGLIIGHPMSLDHKLMAGADMLLMPSRFEPCGLHQMHAMRYGTVPVVRATGGLQDTVIDHTPDNPGVGFKFSDYSVPAMLEALGRAQEAFNDSNQWTGIMRRAMEADFSWDTAAARYEEIYQRAMALRRGQ